MKVKYRPERQQIGDGIWYCHGEGILGNHVDCIMQAIDKRVPLLRFDRLPTDVERITYCQ